MYWKGTKGFLKAGILQPKCQEITQGKSQGLTVMYFPIYPDSGQCRHTVRPKGWINDENMAVPLSRNVLHIHSDLEISLGLYHVMDIFSGLGKSLGCRGYTTQQ